MPLAKVIFNKKINKNYYFMSFSIINEIIAAEPGNFIMIRTNKNNMVFDPLLKRSFVVSDIEDNNIFITYKVIGKGTLELTYYNKNDIIEVSGMLGNSFNYSFSNKKTILIAGGIGIAPFPLLARLLIKQKNNVDLYYGGRTKDDIILLDQFKKLDNIFITTEDGSMGKKGLVTDYINKEYEFAFICGPNVMMMHSVHRLNESCRVEVSMEQRMACGIGICLGCIVNYSEGIIVNKKCCKDGPIFDGRKVQWQQVAH